MVVIDPGWDVRLSKFPTSAHASHGNHAISHAFCWLGPCLEWALLGASSSSSSSSSCYSVALPAINSSVYTNKQAHAHVGSVGKHVGRNVFLESQRLGVSLFGPEERGGGAHWALEFMPRNFIFRATTSKGGRPRTYILNWLVALYTKGERGASEGSDSRASSLNIWLSIMHSCHAHTEAHVSLRRLISAPDASFVLIPIT